MFIITPSYKVLTCSTGFTVFDNILTSTNLRINESVDSCLVSCLTWAETSALTSYDDTITIKSNVAITKLGPFTRGLNKNDIKIRNVMVL